MMGIVAVAGLRRSAAEQGKAIHLRHHHVGQDDCWRPAVNFFQRQFSISRGNDLKTPCKQRADILAHIGVIVHEEQDWFGLGCCPFVALVARDGTGDLVFQLFVPRHPAERFLHICHGRSLHHERTAGILCYLAAGEMLVSEGQANAEGRTLVELALDGDGSAVHLDEFLHEREADSAAFVTAAASSLDAAEALKQMRQFLLRNAGACIAHGEFGAGLVVGD